MDEPYRIYARRGRFLTELNAAPSFPTKAEAEAYASKLLTEQPNLVKQGVEGVEAHQPSSLPSGAVQASR